MTDILELIRELPDRQAWRTVLTQSCARSAISRPGRGGARYGSRLARGCASGSREGALI